MGEDISMHYTRSGQVDASPVGDRIVLYHRNSGKALVLNPTGSFLWECLETPQTLPDLTQRLRARFPSVAEVQAMEDVRRYLQALTEQELIEPDSTN